MNVVEGGIRMTDKEMAEDYADRTRIVDENTRAGADCISLVQDYEGNIIDIHERIKQAYLAGLKAGRPEWHKVADGDLPPTSSEMHAERYPILACTKNGYVTVAIRRKHGRAYEWFCSDYDGNTLYLDKEVIAWCEISKYTEE